MSVGPLKRVVAIANSEAWHAVDWSNGLCRMVPSVKYFPERGESADPAKRVCVSCPILLECGEYALSANERHGVWGGLSERQRRQIRGNRARAEAA